MRTLIVDDEPLARQRLRTLLEKEPDVEVVGECGDGRQALDALRRERPDLLFLDVQMPLLDGFGVLEALGADQPRAVIFVTAYDRHALRAFEVHALDYLLKPFDRDRFRKALERARAEVRREPDADARRRLLRLLEEVQGSRLPPDRLAVKAGGRVVFLKVEEIDWIEAAGNYVKLHAGKETHLLRETMSGVEARLDARFLRVHRSIIVNLERVRELQPAFHGDYVAILHDGTELPLGRGCRDKLRERFGDLF